MVRQLRRSAMREDAVCSTGALCPSSSPGDHHGEHTAGVDRLGRDVRQERGDQRDRGVEHRVGHVLADPAHDDEAEQPDQRTAAGGDQEVEPDRGDARTRRRPRRPRCAARPGRWRR